MTQPAAKRSAHVTRLGAMALVLLAAAALFWPDASEVRGDGTLLVLLPESDPRRVDALAALAGYLGTEGRLDLHTEVVRDRTAFDDALGRALVILCPDGVALKLPTAAWQPLAVGRRRVPWNLRPTSVLLSRRLEAAGERPWLTDAARTVIGDSLSLVCLAPLCGERTADRRPLPAELSWGGDPYDHRGVIEAARQGAFDHAVVRQWDAERALAAGSLDPGRWRLRRLSEPLPDVVMLASRRLAQGVRLDLQEALTVLGRRNEEQVPAEGLLEAQLGLFDLDGFNLLLAPDFDRVRQRYGACWPLHRD